MAIGRRSGSGAHRSARQQPGRLCRRKYGWPPHPDGQVLDAFPGRRLPEVDNPVHVSRDHRIGHVEFEQQLSLFPGR